MAVTVFEYLILICIDVSIFYLSFLLSFYYDWEGISILTTFPNTSKLVKNTPLRVVSPFSSRCFEMWSRSYVVDIFFPRLVSSIPPSVLQQASYITYSTTDLLNCVPACLLVCLSVCLCLSVCVCVCLSVPACLSVSECLSACLSVCLPVCLSACLPTNFWTCTFFATLLLPFNPCNGKSRRKPRNHGLKQNIP